MSVVACDEAGLAAAASVLNSGGVAVIPTDTVYGLAAHPGFPAAVERRYSIKGREARKPIALLAADAAAAVRFLGGSLPPGAAELAAKVDAETAENARGEVDKRIKEALEELSKNGCYTGKRRAKTTKKKRAV